MKPRKSPLPARRARPRAVNPKRKASEWPRAYESAEYVGWTSWQPCAGCHGFPCDVAHTKSGGTGRKADATFTAPLCKPDCSGEGCHRKLHRIVKKTFEAEMCVNLDETAAKHRENWAAEVLRRGAR